MNVFPRSRAARIRAACLFALTLAVCAYRNVFSLAQLITYEPREGDVLFQSLPHGELVNTIEGVTRSEWSHCGVLLRREGAWKVVEAIGEVRETPLALWIMRGRKGRFEAYRAPSLENAGPLRTALARYLGRPYDFHYAPDDSEIYCSELVYKAYFDAYGWKLGAWEPLGSLNWTPFEKTIRAMEAGALPLDREMITPVALTKCKQLTRAFPAASSSAP